MNRWKPKQSPMQSSSSDPPPRRPHHRWLNEAFHNLQSKVSSFLQKPQNFFFNGCHATAQTLSWANTTHEQALGAIRELLYPTDLVYNTIMNLRELKRTGKIAGYVTTVAELIIYNPMLTDDDFLKLAYELQHWAKQEFNFSNRDKKKNFAMSDDEIGERLYKVPVYNIRNADDEVLLMDSSINEWKSMLGHFLSKTDAKAYAERCHAVFPSEIPYVHSEELSRVIDCNMAIDPVRLIPEASEVKNALEVKKKAGLPCEKFSGVPVFESRDLSLCQGYLSLTSEGCLNQSRPVFFRKEDLEKSLTKARFACCDGESNFVDKEITHIEVAAFEDIIRAMKDNSTSEWNNVFFAHPGQNMETSTLFKSYEDIFREMDTFQ